MFLYCMQCTACIVYVLPFFWFRIKWCYITVWVIRHVSTTRMGSILANEQEILCFDLAYVCWGSLPHILFQLMSCHKLESSNSAGMIYLVIKKVLRIGNCYKVQQFHFGRTLHMFTTYLHSYLKCCPSWLVTNCQLPKDSALWNKLVLLKNILL